MFLYQAFVPERVSSFYFPFSRGAAMPEAVIVSAVRTPVGRAYKGSLRATRPTILPRWPSRKRSPAFPASTQRH